MKPPLTGQARRGARQRADHAVEWFVLDEDTLAVQGQAVQIEAVEGVSIQSVGPPPGPRRALAHAALWGVTCLVIVAATTVLWLRAQAGLTQLAGDVTVAVQGEALRERAKTPGLHTTATVEQVAFQTNAAMAEVVVTHTIAPGQPNAGQTLVRREVHFYTHSPQGWRPSLPVAAFWGSPQTLDTAHLHFAFGQLDQEAVAQVAARAETLYRNVHALLGLPDRPGSALLTVEVVPAVVTQPLAADGSRIRVASPYLVDARPAETRADILYAALKQVLVRQAVEAAQAATPPKPQWALLVTALHAWLLATADLAPPGPSRSRGIRQLGEPPTRARPRLVAFLTCVACSSPYPGGSGPSYQLVTQSDLGPWLLDYLVVEYGTEVIPRLLQGFHTYEDWATLAPAVFGQPAAEIEAAWQE